MYCRHCRTELKHIFLDLGFAPPSNAYLTVTDLQRPEHYYPLKIYVCDNCRLVQTADFVGVESLFSAEYAYYSSTSTTWLEHAANYCLMITERLRLDEHSLVIEVASNDGYLLKNFVATGIPCLGIEPTDGTADAAEQLGVQVLREFFGKTLGMRLSEEERQADLIIGNNVLAHVPNINDFTDGLKAALKPDGTVTLEFPHLMNLIVQCQFDTIYHEHFSYLSLNTVCRIFNNAGLRIWDVEEIPTHGGSLRVYACHQDHTRPDQPSVTRLLEKEARAGLNNIEIYQAFQKRAERIKNDLMLFLIEQRQQGKTIAAYGAAAKGNTLLNFAGVKADLIPFVCDAAPSKQGKFLPGSHIPVLSPDALTEQKPDWVIILPWNIKTEIIDQLAHVRTWGGRFVTVIPELAKL